MKEFYNLKFSTAILEMFLKNSFINQTNLLQNGAQSKKPTVNLNRSINCLPLRHPLVVNSCDDFFRTVTKSHCSNNSFGRRRIATDYPQGEDTIIS
jgi:hypothetical protein